MKKTIVNLRYKGEPVYEEWCGNGTLLEFSSRETRKLPDGSWKFVRAIPLHSVRIDERLGRRRRTYLEQSALEYLLTLGVEVV